MTAPTVYTPYNSAFPLFSQNMRPTWVPDELDILRIASYQLYEQIYWSVPTTFKLSARGFEDNPIYIPSGRTLVDTTNRYTAPGFGFRIAPIAGAQPGNDTAAAQLFFDALFTREEFRTRFGGNKRFGLIRGDWAWHITADPLKPQGSRISITSLDPASYFPITDDNNVDKVIGCHIVDVITVGGQTKIRRLTYRKDPLMNGNTGGVTVEEGIFAVDKWGGPENKPEQSLRPVQPLPPQIKALPVYHIKNFEEPQNPFGSSELRGFERLMAAINQGISDEELALALDGIGLYATDAPPPTDADGNEVNWILGPGRVVEHPVGRDFKRVNGVDSVGPFQDHLAFLVKMLRQGSATPDIAVGVVDVAVAESGIARALQLAPLLAKTDEKDLAILDKHGQMFYDLLNGWTPAYEQATFNDQQLIPTIGEKLPVDRAAQVTELNDMLDRKVISTMYYRAEMTKLGYVFPDDIETQIAGDASLTATAADPFGARAATDPGVEE
jgi:hypothetical protein